MTTPTPDRCPVDVQDFGGFRFHLCGRPVKRNGMCGLHARVEEQRELRDREYREEYRANEELKLASERLCDQLSEAGFKATVHYDRRTICYTGSIVLRAEEVEKLLRRLAL